MSPGWTAFTIECIAGSSAGAPAPFRARTAGRAASLRKALALPARSRCGAACASCASVTASATRPRTAASCAWRRAWRVPARPPAGEAWCCGLCKVWRRVGFRARTRGTGAQRTWGHAGALGLTGARRLRGPHVRVRGRALARCAGAKPPPPCACAGPKEVQARGTRPPGSTARTCWRLSALRRTPCCIPRKGGRSLRAHLDQVPLNYPSETVVQPSSTVCGRWEGGDQGPRWRSQRSSHPCRRGSRISSRQARTRRR